MLATQYSCQLIQHQEIFEINVQLDLRLILDTVHFYLVLACMYIRMYVQCASVFISQLTLCNTAIQTDVADQEAHSNQSILTTAPHYKKTVFPDSLILDNANSFLSLLLVLFPLLTHDLAAQSHTFILSCTLYRCMVCW